MKSALCEHGSDAYSYDTCIRTTLDNGRDVINETHYSKTTSRHQGAAHRYVNSDAIKLDNVPRGASAAMLRAMAQKKFEALQEWETEAKEIDEFSKASGSNPRSCSFQHMEFIASGFGMAPHATALVTKTCPDCSTHSPEFFCSTCEGRKVIPA